MLWPEVAGRCLRRVYVCICAQITCISTQLSSDECSFLHSPRENLVFLVDIIAHKQVWNSCIAFLIYQLLGTNLSSKQVLYKTILLFVVCGDTLKLFYPILHETKFKNQWF